AGFFFQPPASVDLDKALESIRPKWTAAKQLFFAEFIRQLQLTTAWHTPSPEIASSPEATLSPETALSLETGFKEMAAAAAIKPGELLQPLRIMLVGGKFGPPVFEIAALLGREETIRRIKHVLGLLS
ncbi:MAG TPA: hypothetical protein VG052_02260, partial [Puia sp.]|nr:hypothetical protein [Puia sp.]